MDPGPFHTVLLVGFMGSGKSTVGRWVGEETGWEFVDLDDVIEARAGRTVEQIFRESGESHFRDLESRAAEDALATPRRVVAPGGGWAARPGRLETLEPDVLTVWLRVEPGTAVERARMDRRARPLLDVPDPVARAAELLEAREPYYRLARLHLDTDGTSPERLGRAIVQYLRTGGDTARR